MPSPLTLFEHFSVLRDPRRPNCLHRFDEMLIIAVCAIICGADSWVGVEEFGKSKEAWLRTFLTLEQGIPSHDTFNRLFRRIDPEEFARCFARWSAGLSEATEGKVVPVDGKCLRKSFDKASNKAAIHMVSAWAAENEVVLASLAVDEKSNEITAVPRLLRLLDLHGCIVTIDAMGCQRAIAEQIIEQGGDYILALKGNQGTLHREVEQLFADALATDFGGEEYDRYEQSNKGHGREERRVIWSTSWLAWLPQKDDWTGLQTVIMVDSWRKTSKKESFEKRYYISSVQSNAESCGAAIREHWGIENGQHYILDVTFREDDCRVRKGYGA
ncbi:MAG: ISAs1 family transposase, partial [Myxococcota bacterium]